MEKTRRRGGLAGRNQTKLRENEEKNFFSGAICLQSGVAFGIISTIPKQLAARRCDAALKCFDFKECNAA